MEKLSAGRQYIGKGCLPDLVLPLLRTRDVQRAQYLYLYLYLLRQQNDLYLYLYLNKSGKRLKNPVFVFITLLILEN